MEFQSLDNISIPQSFKLNDVGYSHLEQEYQIISTFTGISALLKQSVLVNLLGFAQDKIFQAVHFQLPTLPLLFFAALKPSFCSF